MLQVDLVGFQPKFCGKYPLSLDPSCPIVKLDRATKILTLNSGGKFLATDVHEYVVIFLVFSFRQKVEKIFKP